VAGIFITEMVIMGVWMDTQFVLENEVERMVSSREEQEELVKSLMVSPAIRIGKAEMAIGVYKGVASIMVKDTESGIHYSLTFPSQDLEVFPNVNLSLQCVLRFVRTAAQVGILVGEIASGEKAERDNKFGMSKVDPNDPFFKMAGIGRAEDNDSSGSDHDNVLYGKDFPYAYEQIVQWTMELMKADCDCKDTTKILLKMKTYVDNWEDSRKIVRGFSMSNLKCPKCNMPLIELRGTKEFCLEKCEKCDLAVTYPRE